MKKHILLVTLLTTTTALFLPISCMESDSTKSLSLYHKAESQYLLCREELKIAIQNEEDIPLHCWQDYKNAINNFCRQSLLTTLLSPYDKAENQYLLHRETLNIAIQKKEKDILPYWSNYIEALKDFHAAIPDTKSTKKDNIFLKYTTAITNKQQKEIQLAWKDEVKKHKEIIVNKTNAKEKVTIKELTLYQLALKKYIGTLLNAEMRKAPRETADMLAEKMDILAKILCDDINSNLDNYDKGTLIHNYNEVHALQHYSRAFQLKENYILTIHLKQLLLATIKQKYPKTLITTKNSIY